MIRSDIARDAKRTSASVVALAGPMITGSTITGLGGGLRGFCAANRAGDLSSGGTT